jgi:hypothetical protein
MKKEFSNNFIFLIILLTSATVMACFATEIFDENREEYVVLRDESYSMDSAIIIDSLKQGREDNFSLLTETSSDNHATAFPVDWNQDDFMDVAKAFHQFVWKESISEWKLEKMTFNLRCDEIEFGAQGAMFTFFINEKDNGIDVLMSRQLYITPVENLAELLETKYQPVYERRMAIDFSKVDITVEKALMIAETNGGTEFRQEVNDNCAINVQLNAGGKYDGWFTTYSEIISGPGKQLWATINTETGKYKKIR